MKEKILINIEKAYRLFCDKMMETLLNQGIFNLNKWLNSFDDVFKKVKFNDVDLIIEKIYFSKVQNKLGFYTANIINTLFSYYDYWIDKLQKENKDDIISSFKYDKMTLTKQKGECKKIFIDSDINIFFKKYNELTIIHKELMSLSVKYKKFKDFKYKIKLIGNTFGDCVLVFYIPFSYDEIKEDNDDYKRYKDYETFMRDYLEIIKKFYNSINEIIILYKQIIEKQYNKLIKKCYLIFIPQFTNLLNTYLETDLKEIDFETFSNNMIKDVKKYFECLE